MNLIQKIKAPTPKKYKKWGKTFKWLSGALVAGILAVNTAGLVLIPNFNTYIATAIFITSTLSTYCYAQVDEKKGENKNA